MPLIILTTNVPVRDADRRDLLKALSDAVVQATGKPEAYTMALLERADGLFGGQEGPLALADVRGIGGFTRPVSAKLSAALAETLRTRLGIPPERFYCTLTEVAATRWGWKGDLFG